MKRKRMAGRGMLILKLHVLAFVVFSIGLWLSVLATFTYPGNAGVPFETYKPFLIERMNFSILWAIVLLGHFVLLELILFVRRTYGISIYRLRLPDDFDDEYSKSKNHGEDEDILLLEESRQLKSQQRA